MTEQTDKSTPQEPTIEHMEYSKERGFQLQMRHPVVVDLMEAMLAWFKESGGESYCEVSMTHAEEGPFTFIMQRKSGITPAEKVADLERQLAAACKDSERLDWLLSGYAICRWAAEDHSRNDEVLDSRKAIDAAIRRHLTPMEAERKFAQANKETGSTDEV